MSPNWLEEALQVAGLPSCPQFPRDLMADVQRHLPVSVEPTPHLSSHKVRSWLRDRGIHHRVSEADRRLHGCLVARGGTAIAFVDAGDDEAEQRFTLAHEIAHFVLDHMLPRLRALRAFGESIRPVLDEERGPTGPELLSSIIERVSLGLHIHLMSRGASGSICTWSVEESEQRADRFAMELLAPAHVAVSQLKKAIGEAANLPDEHDRAAAHIATVFGLPVHVAGSYVRVLYGRRRSRAPLSKEIFGGK